MDLGKVARTFNNWVRFSNLAGITVPLTSAIQGKVQEAVEAVVKESINPLAYKSTVTYTSGLPLVDCASQFIMNVPLGVVGEDDEEALI